MQCNPHFLSLCRGLPRKQHLEKMTDLYDTVAWGKSSKDSKFSQLKIQRNLPGADDVTFDLKYCGICHTDVHIANNDWGTTTFPVVPGHELAGVVSAIGANVTKFKVGDQVGVGCIVDSCLKCRNCNDGVEHICSGKMTMTYDSKISHGHIKTNSGITYGGFSTSQTVNERFLIKIPAEYPLESAGPLFCSAITMYSPLCHWKAASGGLNVGVIGIGGLGQMGIMLAKAMGNKVTAISTSPAKQQDAMEIGADNFIVSTDEASMLSGADTLDLILNTVSANHQIEHYLPLLRRDGSIVQLGLVGKKHEIAQIPLMRKRIQISGSMIGGIPETQDCMDFCAKHKIFSKIKLVKASELDHVFSILEQKNDQVVRYVLDIEASK